jgi:hypothetical protein
MRQRKKVIYVCIAAFIVMNMAYRVWRMITEGSRPIDWISLAVEILVLGAILWFELPEWRHKGRVRTIVSSLESFLHKGEELQMTVPDPNTSQGAEQWMIHWIKGVNAWSSETHEFLLKHSARAAWNFMFIVNIGVADREVKRANGVTFHVFGRFGDDYQQFQLKLDNLRRLMEKPESYF